MVYAENEPIVVVITGAAGQVAYYLIFMIANGDVFGAEQPVIFHLLDIPPAMEVLEGVCMEIEDLALPLVKGYLKTTDPKIAFKDVDVAFLLGSVPMKQSQIRNELLSKNVMIFKEQGRALDNYAKKDVKVLVIGNPANTNALICSFYAPSISKNNFTALTRLDQNRAHSAIAKRLGICVSQVKNVIIWGNHSSTQFPDASNASVQLADNSISVYNGINDSEWIENEFIETIQNRGSAIIKTRKISSAMSAAKAAVDHMRDWWLGTPNGTWVSMGVVSDGSYGIPKDLVYSMPVTISNKQWKLVKGLKITDFARIKLDLTAMELLKEKEEAMMVCNS